MPPRHIMLPAVLGVILLAPSAASAPSCAARCHEQYNATVERCKKTYAENRRKDWYDDCLKNAERFRAECIRHCT